MKKLTFFCLFFISIKAQAAECPFINPTLVSTVLLVSSFSNSKKRDSSSEAFAIPKKIKKRPAVTLSNFLFFENRTFPNDKEELKTMSRYRAFDYKNLRETILNVLSENLDESIKNDLSEKLSPFHKKCERFYCEKCQRKLFLFIMSQAEIETNFDCDFFQEIKLNLRKKLFSHEFFLIEKLIEITLKIRDSSDENKKELINNFFEGLTSLTILPYSFLNYQDNNTIKNQRDHLRNNFFKILNYLNLEKNLNFNQTSSFFFGRHKLYNEIFWINFLMNSQFFIQNKKWPELLQFLEETEISPTLPIGFFESVKLRIKSFVEALESDETAKTFLKTLDPETNYLEENAVEKVIDFLKEEFSEDSSYLSRAIDYTDALLGHHR